MFTISTDQFLSAFKLAPVGIALEDMEGRPLFVNPALCSLLGFTEEEMRGKHCVDFSPAEDAAKDWALFERLRAGFIDHYQLEKRFLRRDGSLVWGRLTISLLQGNTSSFVIATVEDLSKERAEQETLGRRVLQAQEEERSKVGRELHDTIHQQLVLLSLGMEELKQQFRTTPKLSKRINPLIEQLHNVASEVHSLSHRLHSYKLEYLGLAMAAASLCRDLAFSNKVEISFSCGKVPENLSNEVSLCLYRVLQEALYNAIKHSGSRRIEVGLTAESHHIQLSVHDGGSGFDPAAAMKGPGLGIHSMKQRLKQVEGELSIDSHAQSGTTVIARVPVAESADSAGAG